MWMRAEWVETRIWWEEDVLVSLTRPICVDRAGTRLVRMRSTAGFPRVRISQCQHPPRRDLGFVPHSEPSFCHRRLFTGLRGRTRYLINTWVVPDARARSGATCMMRDPDRGTENREINRYLLRNVPRANDDIHDMTIQYPERPRTNQCETNHRKSSAETNK